MDKTGQYGRGDNVEMASQLAKESFERTVCFSSYFLFDFLLAFFELIDL